MDENLKYYAAYLGTGVKVQRNNSEKNIVELTAENIAFAVKNKDKLILRPISDLTKEIEVNGEKYTYCDLLQVVFCGFHGFMPPTEKIIKNKLNVGQLYNSDYEILLQHHFDVFGLIEKGLAVDYKQEEKAVCEKPTIQIIRDKENNKIRQVIVRSGKYKMYTSCKNNRRWWITVYKKKQFWQGYEVVIGDVNYQEAKQKFISLIKAK